MKIYRKVFIGLVLFAGVGVITYQIGKQKGEALNTIPEAVTQLKEQETEVFHCPYSVDGGIYKEYVRSANEVSVVGKPEFVENPQVIKLNKPFNQQEFEKGLYKLSSDKGWDSRKFDVDGDREDETIISGSVAMNHTPHIAMVVKDGNIIFEADGANIWIEEVYGGQGFPLNETVDWNVGESKVSRYIYKDGGFMPVWTQRICWVNFE